jgi:hypothetical protein
MKAGGIVRAVQRSVNKPADLLGFLNGRHRHHDPGSATLPVIA